MRIFKRTILIFKNDIVFKDVSGMDERLPMDGFLSKCQDFAMFQYRRCLGLFFAIRRFFIRICKTFLVTTHLRMHLGSVLDRLC